MKHTPTLIWSIVVIIIIGALVYMFYGTKVATVVPSGNATSTTVTGDTTTDTGTVDTTAGAKPVVSTSGFASVSSTTAVVVGTVIPNGAATTYWFEYGPDMTYGSSADAVAAPASYKQLGAAAYITGLEPNTSYYFRIGAKNAYGTTFGGQYKFITADK